MDADGNNQKQLTFAPADPQAQARRSNGVSSWSPNGTRIAFGSSRSGQTEIWVMNADGSDQRQLTTTPGPDGQGSNAPCWSPDGSKILFASNRSGTYQAYVMDADGGNVRQLTQSLPPNFPDTNVPVWSPDGSKIVFSSNRGGGGGFQIYVMDADGGNVRQVTQPLLPDFPDATVPAWPPAPGGKIVFWLGIEHRHGEVFAIDADGGNRRQLTDQPGEENSDNPAWSSDGRHIIFETSRSRVRVETWVMDADGSNERLLFPNGGFGGRLPWQIAPPSLFDGFYRRRRELHPRRIRVSDGDSCRHHQAFPTRLAGTTVQAHESAGTERLAALPRLAGTDQLSNAAGDGLPRGHHYGHRQ
ncbi:MAG: hypothetical protein L0387_07640 [Acidobacteria bacterium]|nr:hypothetical protein [Acidobacteriota bacterium]MCI0717414.1 hypothetical protein [Acidobacteriota bacterium]